MSGRCLSGTPRASIARLTLASWGYSFVVFAVFLFHVVPFVDASGDHGPLGVAGLESSHGMDGIPGEKGDPSSIPKENLRGDLGHKGRPGLVGNDGDVGPPGPPGDSTSSAHILLFKGDRGVKGEPGKPGSEIGKLKSFSLSGCDQRTKTCPMYENQPRTIKVSFTPTRDIDHVFVNANTVLKHDWRADENIQVKLTNMYPCDNPNSGMKCPLKKGQTYTWKGQMTATSYDLWQLFYTFYLRIRDSKSWDRAICLQFDTTKIEVDDNWH